MRSTGVQGSTRALEYFSYGSTREHMAIIFLVSPPHVDRLVQKEPNKTFKLPHVLEYIYIYIWSPHIYIYIILFYIIYIYIYMLYYIIYIYIILYYIYILYYIILYIYIYTYTHTHTLGPP